MRLTKLGHACVRIEDNGVRLVIDPGAFSAKDALDGAHGVLVTHEHLDHVVPDALIAAAKANPDLRIWTTTDLAAGPFTELGSQVTGVRHGDRFDVDGVEVNVYGELHAEIHRDFPPPQNVAFRVGGKVFHPGDSFTVPEDPTPTLLAPAGGPWLRVAELIDLVRAVAPKQAYMIHDAVLTETGQNIVVGAVTGLAGEGREIINWQPGDEAEV